ncbi:MAG: hypothetical protein CMO40_07970 [Verrucomicrobiaceae bacterium]|nr:hypothetical protein [Verrucomicrobiaceae bacterium]
MPPHFWLLPIFVLLLAAPIRAGKPRFATLDVAKAFEAYHLTITERTAVSEARSKLQQDTRSETLKLLEVELKDLKGRAKDPALSEDEREEYYRRYMLKNFERDSLKRQYEKHLAEQNRLINEGMVKRTYELLGDLRALARKVAEEEGFDYVFEVSGKTSSQLSTLIYIRDATDLTARIIAELNRDVAAEK